MVSCRCEDDHPYTPFSVTTHLPDSGTSKPPEENPDTPVEGPRAALMAPPGTEVWEFQGRQLRAPRGLVFAQLLELDSDAYAVLVPIGQDAPAQEAEAAGLYRYAKDRKAELIFGVPEFLPRGKDCELVGSVVIAGPSTLAFKIQSKCQTARLAGTSDRAVVLLDWRQRAPAFGIRLDPPAPGETLDVDANAADADGDGRDDRALTFRLQSPLGGQGQLDFAWLTRSAGPSRRTELPAQAMVERASALSKKALRRKERAEVIPEVDALRRAYGSVCAEAKRPRVRLLDGSPLPCGSIDAALTGLLQAAVEAHLGSNQPLAALGEVARARTLGKGPGERVLTGLFQTLTRRVGAVPAASIASLPGPFAEGGWLSWDQAGRLWYHGEAEERVVFPAPAGESEGAEPQGAEAAQAQAASPEEALAPGGLARGPRSPDPRVGPGGRKLVSALPSCDRSEISLLFEVSGVAETPLPTRLLAPRPGNCDRFGLGPLPARVLEYSGSEAIVLVGGEPISTTGAPVELRQPHAWHTALGLIVTRGVEPKIWSTNQAFESLECAVDSAGTKVACQNRTRIEIFEAAPNQK